MEYSLFFRTDASIICFILFLVCILTVLLGRFIRNKFFLSDQQESKGGVASLLGALFGLWAFVLAFTFSNSSVRFDNVRNIMVDKAAYNHWNRQVPSKQIIQRQDFFNQSKTMLIVLHAKVLLSNNFKNTANILAKNLARFNFIPCQIDEKS